MIKKKTKTQTPLAVARKILTYIDRCGPWVFKGRDVIRHTSCTSMAEILPGLAILLDRGNIWKIDRVDSKKPGRPVSQEYHVGMIIKIFSGEGEIWASGKEIFKGKPHLEEIDSPGHGDPENEGGVMPVSDPTRIPGAVYPG